MSTIIEGRNVDSTIAARLAKLSPSRKDRVRVARELSEKRQDAVEAKWNRSQRLQSSKLEAQSKLSRALDLKPSDEAKREVAEAKRELESVKSDMKRNEQSPLPPGGGFDEKINLYMARHSEAHEDVDPVLKANTGSDAKEMLRITVEGVAAFKELREQADSAPLPYAEGVRAINSFVDRMAAKSKISTRNAFLMQTGPSGRSRQGEPRLPHVRVPGVGTGEHGFELIDSSVLFYLFSDQIKEKLIADSARYNSSSALSRSEREAKKADLTEKIHKLEYEAAAWYWKAREDGFTDVEPPAVPVTAFLGIRPAADVPPVNDDFDGFDDNADADVTNEEPDATADEDETADATADEMDFG